MTRFALACVASVLACGAPDSAAPDPIGPCGARTVDVPLQLGLHVMPGAEITTWTSNPPATGTHYFFWAKWGRTYPTPVPRGYWLHNAEHGGMVFLYNCPRGCADQVAALEAVEASMPVDPRCTPPILRRTLVAPDPLLPADVTIAAVAWGYAYTASCVDPDTLREFALAHYGMNYENICDNGSYPDPDPPPVDP
ncbi:MAG TPA: DUF3105 domain-containing protein [Haliangiales bacterium]|nr:DUF3105 domain-containing protein [Haliangiales bacterium]